MSKGHEKSERWTEERLRTLFEGSSDVIIQTCRYGSKSSLEVVMVYADGLTRSSDIGRFVLPELNRIYAEYGSFADPIDRLSSVLPIHEAEAQTDDDLSEIVFDGQLVLLFLDNGVMGSMSIADKPTRQPYESSTEISVKGPRDGFVEDITVNIALIRKRLRSQSLQVEEVILGRRSRTRVGLLYFRDIINPKIIEEIRRRLSTIDVDGIMSISQIEEMMSDSALKLLPTMDFTGRPDYAVNSLLSGRAVLVVDGLPMVLIAPAGLSLILKSPEDAHFNYTYVSFARIIRGISLFLSIFLPAIWVALMSFHQDQIPFRMMATISVSRLGLPLSSHMEMFLLLTLLEIFREAGVRLPSSIGQTLTSIGGLIIGDAAIRAGMVSPSVVVVGAITAVSGVTLVNQTLSSQVSILRFVFFLLSALLGLFGVILGIVLLISYMASLRSFGVPYLSPLSPLNVKELVVSFLRLPYRLMKKRPSVLNTIDSDSQKGGEQ
ncbi:spore germination protein [Paenibacillus sp. 1011MAR3C5]|uniref:spore germination protein n=1 Tax=Paenibacillus sp. 1011MAR3C5 TaxID=1675787 RepID=UPI000E6D2A58|nr:spore germination protein [Paenibacillus sp. 1011MAR3C5]RJE88483.1 spore germination protein [Paenibacillus sp. 1011MAR3C5]